MTIMMFTPLRLRWPPLQLVLLFLLLVLEPDGSAASGSVRRRLIDSEGIPIPETPESVYDVIQTEERTAETTPSSSPVELVAAQTAAQPVETKKPIDRKSVV